MGKTRPVLDRFHEKYVVDAVTGCWEWTAGRIDTGYGALGVDGKMMLAHRFAYEQFVGQIPDGLALDHLCRNRGCCNPEHLNPCTRGENVLAPGSESLAAVNAAKTHCVHGHEFDDMNTYMWRGRRSCRACRKRRSVEFESRQRRQRRK